MKLFSILDVVSQAAMEIGIAQQRVSSVVTAGDQDIAQMQALLFQVADEVLGEEPYRETLGDQNWISSASGVPQDKFLLDTDLVLFDGRLAVNGVKWRFLKAKGLEFGEEMQDFTGRLNKLAARANARVLDLDLDYGRVA
jgi:hypothetical protein